MQPVLQPILMNSEMSVTESKKDILADSLLKESQVVDPSFKVHINNSNKSKKSKNRSNNNSRLSIKNSSHKKSPLPSISKKKYNLESISSHSITDDSLIKKDENKTSENANGTPTPGPTDTKS